MRETAIFLAATVVAGAALAQANRPVPTKIPGITEVPITNQTRDGSVIHAGVRFYFGDPPRKMRELGSVSFVQPQDGPEGEKDFPGAGDCTKSASLALTAIATKVRDMGGDAVTNIGTDPANPSARRRNAILCDRGRVVVGGTAVSTR